jgi:hypothetical protein
MREEERAGKGVVKFPAIVALNALNGGAELRVNVGKKICNGGKGVGL